jgi:autotransporter-associated beta strand protein
MAFQDAGGEFPGHMKKYYSSSSRNEEGPGIAKCSGSFRLLAAILVGATFWAPQATQCGIVNYLGSGDLNDKKSWSTQSVPTSSDEAVFNIGNATITSTGSLNFGDMVWNNNTSASISLKATGIVRYLTLSGTGGSSAVNLGGGSSGDLLLMGNNAKTNTLKFEAIPGNGELQIKLDVDGNFNVLNSGATLDISTVITGTKSLTKTGNGKLILGAANTYTGATTINAGTLSITSITNGGIAGTLGNSTNAAGNLVLGGGTLEYTGFTNGTTDRNFTLTAGTISNISVTNSTVSLSISGTSTATTGGLSKSGQGTLILAGNNTYTGATTISAGTLEIGSAGRLGGGSYSGNIANSATFVYSGANNQTLSGIISGTGALTQNGTGTLRLTGNNTYQGKTTVQSGRLEIASTGALGGTSSIDMKGGSLLIAASNAINDQANIVMGNAKLEMSGENITERVGALTLTGNSVIDVRELQGTNNSLYFASSYLQQGWAKNTSLSIWNWDSSDTNHIYFGTDSKGLSETQLQQISFYSDFGNSFIGNAFISNTGEITTIPEAQTIITAMLILLGSIAHYLRKRYTSG